VDERAKLPLIKKNIILSLLFIGGVIGILLLSFISCPKDISAMTVTPSVTAIALPAPTGLIATAVSTSQINLSWDSVSEAVSYKIYRGGSNIASTTATSYSDTGLSPGTSYTYTVSAVNSSGGESSQSDSASATTQSLPVEGGPTLFPSPPKNISIIINGGNEITNSPEVVLEFSADGAAQIAISSSTNFSGLTWEEYESSLKWILEGEDGEKRVYVKFRTAKGGVSEVIFDSIILDTTAPANIFNFKAVGGNGRISLNWENPPDEDLKGIKIVRSPKFYPLNLSSNVLIYDGKGNVFTDRGLINDQRYYYAAFSYDYIGNISSGAIVSAVPRSEISPEEIPPEEIPPEEVPPEEIPPEEVPPEIQKLKLEDFDFFQRDEKIFITEDGIIKIKSKNPLTVSIDYEKIPEVLKTIMITLEKEENKFSFLLRVNKEKTKYTAVIIIPDPGVYPFTISVLDYKNQIFKKILGKLDVEKVEEPEKPEITPSLEPEIPFKNSSKIILSILGLVFLILLVLYSAWKKKKKKTDEIENEEDLWSF